MLFDLWDHQFCLTCDKQVNIEGAAYCSESCRLFDFEKTASSSPSSMASSPSSTPTSFSWTSPSQSPTRSKFYLSPAYDFSNAQPYARTQAPQDFFGNYTFASTADSTSSNARQLTPSSSQSSLVSMQSASTANGEANQLSDKAKQELRAYAVSFDQDGLVRYASSDLPINFL